ncbi:MAG: AmmeMemoRadiSam system protein B [Methylovirgula sp.]|uniref:AmmeMemoRadiSam system protein B n=1 Tax=Methylovirgula sp. TaxID=1978224 RepID=UPI0030768414
MYADPQPFLDAIAKEQRPPATGLRVTGISVPHHLLAIDLIARGFQAAADNLYDRVIVMSPDHFNRSRRPMATTQRDFDNVFGQVQNDHVATGTLVKSKDLFDNLPSFDDEHGIQALIPFISYFFPAAKVVPIAISYSATVEECDCALSLIEALAGPSTLIIQSTDYSHYLPPDVALQRDQETLNVIAANDVGTLLRLLQPAHMDSKASQYLQMQLQSRVYKSSGTVIANRNSAEYSAIGRKTTSYIVTAYTQRPLAGVELRYSDQQVFYFGGDTFIGRWLTAPLVDKNVAALVIDSVMAITGGAPLIVNLEGVVLDEPPEGARNDLHIMHASLAIPILKAMNVRVVGLASNHSYDLGLSGFEESRSTLKQAGIVPLAHKQIVDVGPFRLLGLNFIGKCDFHNYPVMRDNDLEELCHMQAKPPLLAFVHWGREYTNAAQAGEYAAARAIWAGGVSAIIGAHSHQATDHIEAMQGGEYAMTFSLGNLLFDQTSSRGSGALLEVRVFEQGTYAMRLIPIPNLFEVCTGQLQVEQGSVKSPETSSACSTVS